MQRTILFAKTYGILVVTVLLFVVAASCASKAPGRVATSAVQASSAAS